MAFAPAARRDSYLRLALSGPAGSGKTYTALLIAKMFSDNPGVADSEAGAAKKYAIKSGSTECAGNWRFGHEVIKNKTPDGFAFVLGQAAGAGISPLVVDSYSHSWLGALDEVDRSTGASKFTGGWKKVSPKVSKLVETLLAYPGHLIATMRSKAEYVLDKDEKSGKSAPRKIGMAPVAREGTEYEFDLVFDLTTDQPGGEKGTLTCTKSRCNLIKVGQVFERDDVPALVKTIKAWLDVGAPMSAVEVFTDRIRLCQTLADLAALAPSLAALPIEDKRALKPVYEARKAELTEQAQLDGDAGGIPE